MDIKYKDKSGKILTEFEMKEIFAEKHPGGFDMEFLMWLYLGIDSGAIKVIVE